MWKKWLFVGPHPDDVELGCGGIIAKYRGEVEMYYLVLSPCTDEPKNRMILEEMRNALGIAGITRSRVGNIQRRVFHEQRSRIRSVLLEVQREFDPDLVFCPTLNDVHQDHSVTAEEVTRIFRDKGVLGYEAVRSSVFFRPNLYFTFEETPLREKISIVMCYKSQFDRYYFKPDVIKLLARMRGNQVRSEYAEAFELIRLVISR